MYGKVFVVLLASIALVRSEGQCPDTAGKKTAAANDGLGTACTLIPGCNFLENGTLTPLATQCSNELSDADCKALFPCPDSTEVPSGNAYCDLASAGSSDPRDFPMVRSQACNSPGLRNIALQCASTCALCCQAPEFNCVDDAKSPLDCELNKGKCKDANWTDIMAQYCPKTCGLCDAGGCRDLNTGCNTVASLCKNIDFIDYMRKNCARTCDFCPGSSSSTCRDIASNCAPNVNLCTNTIYRDLMQQQCCATCGGGYGSTGSPSLTCTDTNPSCANWVRNGFCTSTFYTSDQKRQYCGRSCNLC